MTRSVLLTLLLCLVLHGQNTPAPASLQQSIERIVAGKNAMVGVSITTKEGAEIASLNGDRRFPLQSVFKFHIALAVLSQIDNGRFSLDDPIELKKEQLLPGLWSPLREEHPDGGRFTIATLLRYSVSVSDNAACDALLRLAGGPGEVERFIRSHGIDSVAIAYNEEDQQAVWDRQFANWTTPRAANNVLAVFFDNKNAELSSSTHNFLWQVMRETSTGVRRLKGALPKGTVVAHKTGSSGTNAAGVTAAVNDIGVVMLPDGGHFFISVLVSQSSENEATNERLIAEIARAAYDHCAGVPKK